jgi:hypothetical protein
MVDLSKIFSLFNDGPQEEYIYENLETFKKTPKFKLGMFEKLIVNGVNFKMKIVNFFSLSDENFDIDEIDKAGEFMMYNRAWFWISQIDLEDEIWLYDLKVISSVNFLDAIKLSLYYFEFHEEYEKCILLKKVQDIVKENLELQY